MFYTPQFANLGQLLQTMMSQRQIPQANQPGTIQPFTSNNATSKAAQPAPSAYDWTKPVSASMWAELQSPGPARDSYLQHLQGLRTKAPEPFYNPQKIGEMK